MDDRLKLSAVVGGMVFILFQIIMNMNLFGNDFKPDTGSQRGNSKKDIHCLQTRRKRKRIVYLTKMTSFEPIDLRPEHSA